MRVGRRRRPLERGSGGQGVPILWRGGFACAIWGAIGAVMGAFAITTAAAWASAAASAAPAAAPPPPRRRLLLLRRLLRRRRRCCRRRLERRRRRRRRHRRRSHDRYGARRASCGSRHGQGHARWRLPLGDGSSCNRHGAPHRARGARSRARSRCRRASGWAAHAPVGRGGRRGEHLHAPDGHRDGQPTNVYRRILDAHQPLQHIDCFGLKGHLPYRASRGR